MQIKFIDVGRNKRNWEVECAELTYDFMYGQVKLVGGLLSQDIDFMDDGRIIAGFRTVGKFKVIQ